VLFPEGTRSPDGHLQKAKAGVGLMACKTGVPVVPCRVYGSFAAFGKGAKVPNFGTPVSIVFGPPIAAADYDDPAAGKPWPRWKGGALVNANLWGANLQGANLQGANLQGANLWGANLQGAKRCVACGPVGEYGRLIYGVAHADGPRFQAGCFWGTETEIRAAIAGKYADGTGLERHRAAYLSAVDFIVAALANRAEVEP
jgi:uncharacterized protein YjbI with pentapeptide repeats